MTPENDSSPINSENLQNNAGEPAAEPAEKGRKSLKERIRQIKTTRWIRFGVGTVIFFLCGIWM